MRRWSPRARVLLGAILVLVLAGAGTLGYLALRERWGGPAPRVEALTTESGSIVSDSDLVPSGTPLRLTFSAAMDTSSVRLLANNSPLGLTWAPDHKSAALDVASLHRGRVALSVASGARDAAGNSLAAWGLTFSLVFGIATATVRLSAPALVQVPNDPSARDQVGLQPADLVYEYLTEGGITRSRRSTPARPTPSGRSAAAG